MKNLPQIDANSYQPLREQVYELLRLAILNGLLKPDEQITEIGIAEQLNVSRTPVREAIRMLEQEGFIAIVPRKGAFVAGIQTIKQINDIFQVRIVLEALAASLAAERIRPEQTERLNRQCEQIEKCMADSDIDSCVNIDTAFHKLICDASDNEWLQRILDSLFEQITRFRSASLSTEGRMRQALEEHMELAQAIAAGDAEKASQLAQAHLEHARHCVLSAFQSIQ